MIQRIVCLAIAICLLGFMGANAQKSKTPVIVSGVVADSETGKLIADVNVTLVGTSISTRTDSSGRYAITLANAKGTLRFTHASFNEQRAVIDSRMVVNVTMSSAEGLLNDVVVVGYGTVRKKDLTGSVSKVNIPDLLKAPVSSFDQALAGRVAGVKVTSTDGQPGEGFNIVIRGSNSLTYSNSPLFVVDGFPMEDFNTSSLNPAEIESMEILKDASATAIYGARGANGVVMITTKRGRVGSPRISYEGSLGVSNASGKQFDMLDPYEFVKLQLEVDSTKAAATYFKGGRHGLEDFRNVKGVDWYDLIMRPAFFQNHTISVSGGSNNTKYFMSGSYLGQNGVMINSGFERLQTRLKLDQNLGNKARVGININYTNSKRDGTRPREQTAKAVGSGNSQQSNVLYAAWTYRPIAGADSIDLTSEDIDPEIGDYLFNPLLSVQNEYNVDVTNELTLNGYLEFDILKSLKLRVTGSANIFNQTGEIFNNSKTRSGSPFVAIGRSNGINGGITQDKVVNLGSETSLTYNKEFNRNNRLTATGVFSVQTRDEQDFGYRVNQIPNEELGISGLDEGIVYDKTSEISNWGQLSFTGRLNYSLFQKYLFTATMRADGSSKFPSQNRWGYFPSGAIAWRIGDEKFMKGLPFISDAKIRASYGRSGNNRISDFGYQQRIILGTYYSFGNTPAGAYYANNLENGQLKWETTGQFDLGLELGFLNNRIGVEVDYYKKSTYDLLLNATISTSTGYPSALVNIGKTQNTGLEVTLNSTNIKSKDFTWNSQFNISFNRNELISLTNGEDRRFSNVPSFSTLFGNPAWISRTGQPLAQYYGFLYDGVYQYSDFDEVSSSPGTYILKNGVPGTGGILGTSVRAPGDAKYKDINGDGVVNDADQTIIGTPYPKYIGGLSNNFTYKNFDLSVFFQWSNGNTIMNANKVFLEGLNGASLGRNSMASYADRWTPENQNTSIPRSKAVAVTGIWSDRYIEDGSFLRLKTVSLGYTIDTKQLKVIKSAQVFGRVQNLYTWTKYSGPDPEVSVKGFGLTPGFDFSAYPIATTFVFGVNLSF